MNPAPALNEAGPRRRGAATRLVLALCAGLLFALFSSLGTWQVKRLYWKLDLIDRVEKRVHAPPVPAPGPEQWARLNAAADEYRHVRLVGTFLPHSSVRVQASTELGSGYWLLTALRTFDGSVVLVNRGFLPLGTSVPADAATPRVTSVTGLLRISEPGGAFLRHNDPAANRWYSRDVQAIATARALGPVAPYFVDADAADARDGAGDKPGAGEPVGGLTVISFHNNHVVYAFTWYALALMVAGAGLWVAREERNLRRRGAGFAD